jgi:hypothetical protein
MNPGTPVSTTVLNLTRDLIPSLISRMASSGRVETSKFSLIRLGVFEVVRDLVRAALSSSVDALLAAGVQSTAFAILSLKRFLQTPGFVAGVLVGL